jgi:hypothetical protein
MRQWQAVTAPEGAPGVRDWGQLAFETALEHLEAVQQAERCAEGGCELHGEGSEEHCLFPAVAGLGCNACDECTVREVLIAAWPVIEAAIRSGDFDGAAAGG